MDPVQPPEPRRLFSAGSLNPTFLGGGTLLLASRPDGQLTASRRAQLRPGQSRTQTLHSSYLRGADVEGASFVFTRAKA